MEDQTDGRTKLMKDQIDEGPHTQPPYWWKDHIDGGPYWWEEQTDVGSHWWRTILIGGPNWWRTTLMEDQTDGGPHWWRTKVMEDQTNGEPNWWRTKLIDEGPNWWREKNRSEVCTLYTTEDHTDGRAKLMEDKNVGILSGSLDKLAVKSTGSEINEDLHDGVGISLGTRAGGLNGIFIYKGCFCPVISSTHHIGCIVVSDFRVSKARVQHSWWC